MFQKKLCCKETSIFFLQIFIIFNHDRNIQIENEQEKNKIISYLVGVILLKALLQIKKKTLKRKCAKFSLVIGLLMLSSGNDPFKRIIFR